MGHVSNLFGGVSGSRGLDLRTVVVSRAGGIAGRVLGIDGRPQSGVEVLVHPTPHTGGGKTTTKPDGTFALVGLPEWRFSVAFHDRTGAATPVDDLRVKASTFH